ncbi:MAG: WecB/TagA/CpsF family glycosyltransferase [Patescibacteria group bacterium]|nr:WecB/TagA/CpsF family glycosyltransferase [Patescibacteria group bacterium]
MKNIKILGVKVTNIGLRELREKIKEYLNSNKQRFLTTVNPEIILKAHKNEDYKKILNKASLSLPDGFGLVLASRFKGQKIKKRITGNDLIEIICAQAEKESKTVYLLGGRKDVPAQASYQLKEKYPDLEIVGFDNSRIYSERIFSRGILKKIIHAKPDILLVALGAPKQEKWIARHLRKMISVKIAVGVGGAFDFLAGQIKRAPNFMQKMGLEWLWRLFWQPWRLFRIFNAVFRFSWVVIKNKKNE